MKPNKWVKTIKKDDENIDQINIDVLCLEFRIIMKTVRDLTDEEFKAFNKRLMSKE